MIRIPDTYPMPDGGQGVSIGSGALVAIDENRRGCILTAAHVAREGSVATAYWDNGQSRTGAIAARDERSDLACFFIDDVPEHVQAIPVMESDPAIGSTYFGIGHSKGGPAEEITGRLYNLDYGTAKFTAGAIDGMSGGPMVFTGMREDTGSDRRLAGIISGSDGRITTGASVAPIRSFLAQHAPWCLNPRRRAPRRPQQPQRPANPPIVTRPQKPQDDRVASLERKVDEQSERIAELIRRLEGSKPRDGKDGSDGKDGDDAVVDIDVLAAVINEILDARQPVAVTKPKQKRKMQLVDTIKVKAWWPRGK